MFEKFLSQGARDFRQRYEGTYGFFRDDEHKRMLAQLVRITDTQCIFHDSRGVEYRLNADADGDKGFEFIPPKSGYFNTDIGAMYVQRNAARQFQRGVSGNNTSVYLLSKGSLIPREISFPVMVFLFEKAREPRDSLDAFLMKKIPSWSPSSPFCFDANNVWVFAERIGTWSMKDTVFNVNLNDKTLYRTEIADAFAAVDRQVGFV